MAETKQPTVDEEYINKMYDSKLNSHKEQLTQSYNQAISDLDTAKQTGQQNLAKNLNATAVESQRAQKNYNEVQNAYGLTSGAMAQARLAQDNQLQADLTTLRAAQQTADAGIEQERALLAQQYTSAITQAQAENDLARAQALYESAKEADAQLLAKQEAAAKLMAGVGDYTLLGQLYGLTPEQIAKLSGKQVTGTYTPNNLDAFGVSKSDITNLQYSLGVNPTGAWNEETAKAAGTSSAAEAWSKFNQGEIGSSVNTQIAQANKAVQNFVPSSNNPDAVRAQIANYAASIPDKEVGKEVGANLLLKYGL